MTKRTQYAEAMHSNTVASKIHAVRLQAGRTESDPSDYQRVMDVDDATAMRESRRRLEDLQFDRAVDSMVTPW